MTRRLARVWQRCCPLVTHRAHQKALDRWQAVFVEVRDRAIRDRRARFHSRDAIEGLSWAADEGVRRVGLLAAELRLARLQLADAYAALAEYQQASRLLLDVAVVRGAA